MSTEELKLNEAKMALARKEFNEHWDLELKTDALRGFSNSLRCWAQVRALRAWLKAKGLLQ